MRKIMKTTTEQSIWAQISDYFNAKDLVYTDIESLHVYPIDFSDSFNLILPYGYTDDQLTDCISELDTLVYDYFNGSINLVDGGTVYMEVDERTIYLDEKGFMLDPSPVSKKSLYTDIYTSKITPDSTIWAQISDFFCSNDLTYTDIESFYISWRVGDGLNEVALSKMYTDDEFGEKITILNALTKDIQYGSIFLRDGAIIQVTHQGFEILNEGE